jgi:carboxymethylenebutenolidase
MPLETKDVAIPVAGASMPAFMAVPADLPAPALVIVPSIFGVGAVARETATTFARNGYLTIVLDVFFRTSPGPKNMSDGNAMADAFARADAFDHERGQRDMTAARDYALALPECNGKWAMAGYCFGGRYALLAGAYMGADAVAAFHPSRMGRELEAAAKIRVPASFHFGGADAQVPMTEIEAVQAALAGNPRAETYVYPGVAHGFTTPGGPAYSAEATRDSMARVLAMLARLKTPARV